MHLGGRNAAVLRHGLTPALFAASALTLACAGSASDDVASYAAALRRSGDEAWALCQQIAEPSARGDCVVHVAADAASAHDLDGMRRYCGSLTDPPWSTECWFLAADRARLVGPEARALCDRAGSYELDCRGHVIDRELGALTDLPTELGQEVALRDRLRQELERLEPDAGSHALQSWLRVAMGEHLARRWEAVPFDAALCGSARRGECLQAYRDGLRARARQVPFLTCCATDGSFEALDALGCPTWAPGGQQIAEEAWTMLCTQARGGPSTEP